MRSRVKSQRLRAIGVRVQSRARAARESLGRRLIKRMRARRDNAGVETLGLAVGGTLGTEWLGEILRLGLAGDRSEERRVGKECPV